MYSYKKSLKSNFSDELINTYLIRPIAGFIVWAIYYTPITPNQVTLASIGSGLIASYLYYKGSPGEIFIAGLLVTLKDVLDSADGQLARVKNQYSRVGRFLDSIGDFIVNAALFSAIGWSLFRMTNQFLLLIAATIGFLCVSLRVSYHVFYQVNFLHLTDQYNVNRVSEIVQKEDVNKGGLELALQRIFQVMYGWQDRLIARIDRWSGRESLTYDMNVDDKIVQQWYSDRFGLRFSSMIGLATELFLLMICSLLNRLEWYLVLNLCFMNGIFLLCVFYRRFILLKILQNTRRG